MVKFKSPDMVIFLAWCCLLRETLATSGDLKIILAPVEYLVFSQLAAVATSHDVRAYALEEFRVTETCPRLA